MVLGDPLPDNNALPDSKELVCVENPETHSNVRTVPVVDQGSNGDSGGDFNPSALDSGVEPSIIHEGFEGFEPIQVGTIQTVTMEGGYESTLAASQAG